MPEYLKLCVDYDNSLTNTKYAVEKFHSLNGRKISKMKISREFEDAEKMADVW